MLNYRSLNSCSQILSAVICLCFSFSVNAQIAKNGRTPTAVPQQSQQQQLSGLALQQNSIALQQQSIQRNREAVQQHRASQLVTAFRQGRSLELAAAALGVPSPQCAAVSPLLLERSVQNAATAYNVAPNLIHAVIQQESGGYPCAVSEKGAMGLMQLMPATATQYGASEPFDVEQNVLAGTRFLAELMQRYSGDLNRVLGAYNAGPGAVDRAGGIPEIPETVNYVRSILGQVNSASDPKLFDLPIR
jgi:soluble lytic murein transglycosylase-like protein